MKGIIVGLSTIEVERNKKQLSGIYEAGYKSAEARRNKDEAGAKFHKDWADKAIRFTFDRKSGEMAFSTGYARFALDNPTKPEPFR